MQAPVESAVVVKEMPVLGFVTTISAAGTMAPEASVICPRIELVISWP